MSASPFREMLPQSPPVPPRKQPLPAESRQISCTHRMVTRLFDKFDTATCSSCQRHPSLGWLYRCTQDTDGFLPGSDFSEDTFTMERGMKLHPGLRDSCPAPLKAIDHAQYTTEQIQELTRQKESVREAIQDDTRPTTSSSSTEHSTTFSELPESTSFSTNTSASIDEAIRVAYDWPTLAKVWQAEATTHEPQEPRLSPTGTALDFPTPSCTFKVCATCRPTYRERAFQSLDQIIKNPKWMPQWELDNRRLSDARVVRKIGLRKTVRFYAQTNGQDIDSQNTFVSHSPSSHDEAHVEPESIEEATSKRHSRSGFRETVRNALKRARSDQPTCLDNDATNNSADSSTESLTPFRRSMIFMRRRSRPLLTCGNGSSTRIVGNESLHDSLNLMLASNTPLPPSGPNTPMYPPNQPKRKSEEKKENNSGFDEIDFMAYG